MDTARYILAFVVVATLPPALAFWFIVHPFIDFWRRIGPTRTYIVLLVVLLPAVYGISRLADTLLAVDYGSNYLLWLPALLSYAVAVRIELKCRKHLSFRILVGVPELRPPASGGRLLQEGIYGKVRHPRYVGIVFGMIGVAFFVNFLAVYVLTALITLGFYGVVLFEERELRRRFGEAYERYAERVPRFVPRLSERESD